MKKKEKDYIKLQVAYLISWNLLFSILLILHFEPNSFFFFLVGTVESSIDGEKERIKIWNGDYEFATGPLSASCVFAILNDECGIFHLIDSLMYVIERREAAWDLEWQED